MATFFAGSVLKQVTAVTPSSITVVSSGQLIIRGGPGTDPGKKFYASGAVFVRIAGALAVTNIFIGGIDIVNIKTMAASLVDVTAVHVQLSTGLQAVWTR